MHFYTRQYSTHFTLTCSTRVIIDDADHGLARLNDIKFWIIVQIEEKDGETFLGLWGIVIYDRDRNTEWVKLVVAVHGHRVIREIVVYESRCYDIVACVCACMYNIMSECDDIKLFNKFSKFK